MHIIACIIGIILTLAAAVAFIKFSIPKIENDGERKLLLGAGVAAAVILFIVFIVAASIPSNSKEIVERIAKQLSLDKVGIVVNLDEPMEPAELQEILSTAADYSDIADILSGGLDGLVTELQEQGKPLTINNALDVIQESLYPAFRAASITISVVVTLIGLLAYAFLSLMAYMSNQKSSHSGVTFGEGV